jgi:hypothetical protein
MGELLPADYNEYVGASGKFEHWNAAIFKVNNAECIKSSLISECNSQIVALSNVVLA